MSYCDYMDKNIKNFIIKLTAITISIIIIVNILFNLLLGERLEKIDELFSLSDSATREKIRNKIREELESGLEKEQLLSDEDKILIFRLYQKIKKEFEDIEKKNLSNNN